MTIPTIPRAAGDMNDEEPGRELTPWQYSSRTLLGVMLVASLLFTLWRWLGPLWSLAMGWVLIMIGVHVAANFWGGKTFRPPVEPTPSSNEPPPSADDLFQFRSRTQNRLNEIQVGRSRIYTSVGGVVVGLGVGLAVGVVFCFTGWTRTSINSVALATLSSGVLGGFFGFWVGSFLVATHKFHTAGLEGERAETSAISTIAAQHRERAPQPDGTRRPP